MKAESLSNVQNHKFLIILVGFWIGCSTLLFSVDATPPAAPSNVTIQYETDTSVKIGWTDNANDEQGFKVYRRYLPSTYVEIEDIGTIDAQEATITGLDPAKSYLFAVSAYHYHAPNTESEKVNSPIAYTTHTWDGALQECVNEALRNGEPTHIPTRAELENLHEFVCNNKDLTEMDPIQDLKNLTKLELRENSFDAPLPTWIEKLTNLTRLDFYHSKLTGTIPPGIEKLTNLTRLNLSSNQLTGTIPTSIEKLKYLSLLNLGINQLTGTIASIVKIEGLLTIGLSGNQFTGTIPAEIGNLISLTNLDMHDNQFIGTIPSTLGLSQENLKYLDLSSNQLTGTIPIQIGLMGNLEKLYLAHNYLSGEIPLSLIQTDLVADEGLYLEENCNLYSDEIGVQSWIVSKSPLESYEDFLETQGHCSPTLAPVIMYLLD